MLNCFGPVRSRVNIIGSVRGRGHNIYYFSVQCGSGQKITGQYGVGVSKVAVLPQACSRKINIKLKSSTAHPSHKQHSGENMKSNKQPSSLKCLIYVVKNAFVIIIIFRFISGLFAQSLTRMFEPRYIILACGVLASTGLLLCSVASNIPVLFVGMFLTGSFYIPPLSYKRISSDFHHY